MSTPTPGHPSAPGPSQDVRPVRRALVSVYDKTGLDELVRGLHEAGVELVSTGGSAARIDSLGIPVTRVEELTEELEAHRAASGNRFFAVGPSGDVVPLRHGQRPQRRSAGQALVIWQPRNRP